MSNDIEVIFHFCYGDSNHKHVGTRRRIATGERHFGTSSVATECGFRPAYPATIPELLLIRAEIPG
jgi:hypothetical protein